MGRSAVTDNQHTSGTPQRCYPLLLTIAHNHNRTTKDATYSVQKNLFLKKNRQNHIFYVLLQIALLCTHHVQKTRHTTPAPTRHCR